MIVFYPTGEQTVQHDLKKERASIDSESHIYKCWSQGYEFDFEDCLIQELVLAIF